MFFVVIIAYVLAAVFAFCGIINTASCIMDAQREMGYFNFIEGLVIAMWPLAVAATILLLVQIACKLERWMLLWTMQSGTPARPGTARHQSPHTATPAATTPSPAIPHTPAQGGRETTPATTSKPAENKQEGLSFFKLD